MVVLSTTPHNPPRGQEAGKDNGQYQESQEPVTLSLESEVGCLSIRGLDNHLQFSPNTPKLAQDKNSLRPGGAEKPRKCPKHSPGNMSTEDARRGTCIRGLNEARRTLKTRQKLAFWSRQWESWNIWDERHDQG